MSDRKSTLKEGLKMELIGFDNSSVRDQLVSIFNRLILQFSEITDVSGLEGISFCLTNELYAEKLRSLDDRLAPSNDEGVGVAMTVDKINGEFGHNYIVINCHYLQLEHLLEEYKDKTTKEKRSEVLNQFAYILFHEMCHVRNNVFLYDFYRDFAIKESYDNSLEAMRNAISRICWDEFLVCSEANRVGADQLNNFENIIINIMNSLKKKIGTIFKQYLINISDEQRYRVLFNETFILIYNFFKYASYYLGDIFTKEDIQISDRVREHELGEFVIKLNQLLIDVYENIYTENGALDQLGKIGDLAEELASSLGLEFYPVEGSDLYVNLTYAKQAELLAN
ncbi:hypothetical protein I5730_08635 [Acinetobacter nosocomialis]|uniref:hypothetical protein n=1 Tax=Acinetobacter nosocomialis TaxID=106654 RepID=UPI001900AC27|nr:hypothetical protein [Acinetobacter nosocomialis]MBJ9960608.1 hypothetical protein [Acinetobacter nosocomialis]UUG68507.1 hypothetical protein [Acinetobacter phage TCUAN1]